VGELKRNAGISISLPALTTLGWLGSLWLAYYLSEKFSSPWLAIGVLVLGLIASGKIKTKEILELLENKGSISLGNLTKSLPPTKNKEEES
jgi:hypothetical protein